MPLFQNKLFLYLLIIFSLLSGVSQADVPENLDFFGGYYKDGVYTCYVNPCFKIHKGTESSAAHIRQFEIREWVPKKGSKDACQKSYSLVLANNSQVKVGHKKFGDCILVTSGQWEGFYSKQTIKQLKNIAVDHLISFKEAHYYGASLWSKDKRRALIQDPLNLIVVSKMQKILRSGLPASQWMPEYEMRWCDYIVKRDLVVRRYKMRLPKHEKDFHNEMKKLYCKY